MARHTTARLYCTKDTHVSKTYPTVNFHSADYTNMGVAGGQQNTALLAFDTNHGIPSGARIVAAKFHFRIDYASENATFTFTTRPCSGTWTETGVTWNTIPATSDVSDTAAIGNSTTNIDITNTFKSWFSGKYAMGNGFYITCATASSRKRLKQRTDATVNDRPYLVIDWEDPISVPVADKNSYALGSTLKLTMQGAGSDRTHKVTYKIGTTTVRTATNVGASDTYTLPLTLANYITTSTSAVMTITCETFISGASQGTASTSVTLTVPGSVVPTISAVNIAEGASGFPSSLNGTWVQGVSKPKVTVTAAGIYGSTITSYTVKIGNVTVSGNPAQFGALTQSGTLSVVATVTDSRGRRASSTTSISAIAYAPPKVSVFQATRCDSTGTADDSGLYLRISANASASSLTGLNTLSCKVQYRQVGTTTWRDSDTLTVSNLAVNVTKVLSSGGIFSDSLSYELRLATVDLLTTSYTYVTVSTRTVYLDVNCNGTGVGIGTAAGADGELRLGLTLNPATADVRRGSLAKLSNCPTHNPRGVPLTYDTLQEAGLTASTTTENFALGLPTYSEVTAVHSSGNAVILTDMPGTYGLLHIKKGYDNNYIDGWFWGTTGKVYVYKYHTTSTDTNGWHEVITSLGGTMTGRLTANWVDITGGEIFYVSGIMRGIIESTAQNTRFAAVGNETTERNRRILTLANQDNAEKRYAAYVQEQAGSKTSNYYIPIQTDWIELTPASGVTTPGTYGNGKLRYRAEGKHVYIAGSVNVAWDGSSNKLIGTLPAGYRPTGGYTYFLVPTGGNTLSRFFVRTDGAIYMEWKKTLGGSNDTTIGWFDLNMDFWID